MFSEVVFDVETKTFFDEAGTFDPSKLGVSIVSLYTRGLDENLKEIEGMRYVIGIMGMKKV